jgi:hypothetical protein
VTCSHRQAASPKVAVLARKRSLSLHTQLPASYFLLSTFFPSFVPSRLQPLQVGSNIDIIHPIPSPSPFPFSSSAFRARAPSGTQGGLVGNPCPGRSTLVWLPLGLLLRCVSILAHTSSPALTPTPTLTSPPHSRHPLLAPEYTRRALFEKCLPAPRHTPR